MFIDTSQTEIYRGKCEDGLAELEDSSVQLVLTSPPYNVGKEYEDTQTLDAYLDWQSSIIRECYRVLSPTGSICWQVGNSIEKEKGSTEVVPLDCIFYPIFKDLGFKLRNRIVWTFSHGLHCSNRFSGRHETILWWSKSDDFTYNLDPVRVPQKYPGKKYYKGPKKGQLSSNPLGANPGDVWPIPNVKHNHVEKTSHPCQFPVELAGTLILSLSNKGDMVVDPFAGSCTTGVAAAIHERRCVCMELYEPYADEGQKRLSLLKSGSLKVRSDRWKGS
tara:strand:- start:23853 stop:24680 length:828 start_codon:yes stop_codon:yes gene_type:complete